MNDHGLFLLARGESVRAVGNKWYPLGCVDVRNAVDELPQQRESSSGHVVGADLR